MLNKKTILGIALLATACTTYDHERSHGELPGYDAYDGSSFAGGYAGGASTASHASTRNSMSDHDYGRTNGDHPGFDPYDRSSLAGGDAGGVSKASNSTPSRDSMTEYEISSSAGEANSSDVKARESSYGVGRNDVRGLSAQDREFVTEAMAGGMFEVESARLGLENLESDADLDMARMLIEDHTKANRELEAIATRNGVTPSHALGSKQALVESLRSSSGPAFHARYQQQQLEAHRDAIKLFEDEARDGTNADLKAFAARTLPTLRKHLDMLQRPHVARAH